MSHTRPSFTDLENRAEFVARHIGPDEADTTAMLATLKLKTLDDMITQTIPAGIRLQKNLDLGESVTEASMLAKARTYANQNVLNKSMIGQGYYGTLTPTVVLRNVLENPAWYTAYTPYQAEIAQGRLEALLNFQTMIMDLTGMSVSNASLLDEGTAAAEGMHLAQSLSKNPHANRILVSNDCHPQTIEVLSRRAEPLDIKVVVGDVATLEFDKDTFAVLIQYPSSAGHISDYTKLVESAHAHKALVIVAADLLALTMLKAPGEWGADIVVGSAQRFGVPMGFGGPHAGYMATKDEYKRGLPGRLVGVSVDMYERPALRLALQTREQHIRREKATSNICTAQVLLAVMASMYAVYHGPKGLTRIATRTHRLASTFAAGVKQIGFSLKHASFFDTVAVEVPAKAKVVMAAALKLGFNLRLLDENNVSLSFDETSTSEDVTQLWQAFAQVASKTVPSFAALEPTTPLALLKGFERTSAFMTHPTFNSYHSETEMLRYMMRLQSKDLSLAHSMIPLGSCTMKLNSTSEMIPVTWPEFNSLHPFVPVDQAKGSIAMIRELEGMLSELTGFAGISLQPNAGSAGEYAGLLAIRDFHRAKGNSHRNICLIPSSAHGTNPASAAMAGMKVVVTACDSEGNVDIADLRAKAEQHKENLAALMITYPSTHGVFEEGIKDICAIIHEHGGQVYMDGANFNALVGFCRPGDFRPRRLPFEPAQNLLYPARRRGPRRGTQSALRRSSEGLSARVTRSTPHSGLRGGAGQGPLRRLPRLLTAAPRFSRSRGPTSR